MCLYAHLSNAKNNSEAVVSRIYALKVLFDSGVGLFRPPLVDLEPTQQIAEKLSLAPRGSALTVARHLSILCNYMQDMMLNDNPRWLSCKINQGSGAQRQ